eukprot:COSAG02_NODE_4913_length_4840_cov_2.322717_9_plen_59_part_00
MADILRTYKPVALGVVGWEESWDGRNALKGWAIPVVTRLRFTLRNGNATTRLGSLLGY